MSLARVSQFPTSQPSVSSTLFIIPPHHSPILVMLYHTSSSLLTPPKPTSIIITKTQPTLASPNLTQPHLSLANLDLPHPASCILIQPLLSSPIINLSLSPLVIPIYHPSKSSRSTDRHISFQKCASKKANYTNQHYI